MRNKLLLTAFLSVISTGMPAYAVDYVTCREMLRTKNEFIKTSNSAEVLNSFGIERENEVLYGGNIYEICRDKDKDNLEEMSIFDKSIIEITNTKKETDCWKRMGIGNMKGKYKINNMSFHTQEGLSWYKKALKVEADMRRANCPYWTNTPPNKKRHTSLTSRWVLLLWNIPSVFRKKIPQENLGG